MTLARFPRQTLGFWPTPLVALDRLSSFMNSAQLYMKRDDQSGLALGGNKTRKLEYLLGDALAQGCDTLITAGASQSNHCRQTAAAAASVGLECHLLLGGEMPLVAEGNLLLDQILGAHIHWTGSHRRGEDIDRVSEELRGAGRLPYVIPYGGSNPRGALGFVRAGQELALQTQQAGLGITHVVFASSSGGTQAGLVVGAQSSSATYEILGIRIDKEESEGGSFGEKVLDLARQTAHLIKSDASIEARHIVLDESVLGDGYGVVGDAEREAISLVARHEGILLDPVYTGRAMAGLVKLLREGRFGPDDHVLFWHTGGLPALFSHAGELSIERNAPWLGKSQ